MPEQDKIHDSPEGWVAKHIRNYVETDGGKGQVYYGVTSLLLTTVGRKSGLKRRTALYYGQDGNNYVVVASNGGDSKHPAWYLNLAENPTVELQVGADKFTAVAHAAAGEERTRLWQLMADLFPTYDRYQAKTDRDIPVVVLVPTR